MQCNAIQPQFLAFDFSLVLARSRSCIHFVMDQIAPNARLSHDGSVKSFNIDVLSIRSRSGKNLVFDLYRLLCAQVLTRNSLIENLEAASTSIARFSYHHSSMLGVDCYSPVLPYQKPARWGCNICGKCQCVAYETTVLVFVFSHCCRRSVQHLLGLDRSGDETNGTLLPDE